MLSGKAPDPVQNSSEGSGKTREKLADIAGVSHDTLRKAEHIREQAVPEVVKDSAIIGRECPSFPSGCFTDEKRFDRENRSFQGLII